MTEVYSRICSASLIKEATANVPLTPTNFFHLNEEDIAFEYAYTPAMPVAANRVKNLRAVKNKILSGKGTLTVNVDPKTWGHFLNGVFGGVTSGRYLPISGANGTFTVGETVTGGTSSATGTVALSSNGEFLLLTSPSGTFTAGETITGGSSGFTATVTTYSATVYGHVGTLPDSSFITYTLQINLLDSAYRYFGVRFGGLDAIGQKDNIITAGIKVTAQGQFRHAKVTAITASGAGTKTLTLDQTLGLVAGDSIKLYRTGSGFLDFSASSVKTHTVATVASTTTITVTDLQTSTAVGDLIMLAPQTASYTTGNEFQWIGGSVGYLGAAIASLAAESLEDFTYIVDTEFEDRHAATGTLMKDRFPSAVLEKGHVGSGTFKAYYNDEDFMRLQRLTTPQAFRVKSTGDLITGTLYNQIWFTFPAVILEPYQTNLAEDKIIDEDIKFTAFNDTSTGYFTRSVLINDVAAY